MEAKANGASNQTKYVQFKSVSVHRKVSMASPNKLHIKTLMIGKIAYNAESMVMPNEQIDKTYAPDLRSTTTMTGENKGIPPKLSVILSNKVK